jgi:hybrid cluster-associated redox disulfide protein
MLIRGRRRVPRLLYLRQRKDRSAAFPYDVSMRAEVSGECTVEETMRVCADAVSTFVRLKTHCVGCRLARFCTLEEVSRHYGIPLDSLLERLRNPAALSRSEE